MIINYLREIQHKRNIFIPHKKVILYIHIVFFFSKFVYIKLKHNSNHVKKNYHFI